MPWGRTRDLGPCAVRKLSVGTRIPSGPPDYQLVDLDARRFTRDRRPSCQKRQPSIRLGPIELEDAHRLEYEATEHVEAAEDHQRHQEKFISTMNPRKNVAARSGVAAPNQTK